MTSTETEGARETESPESRAASAFLRQLSAIQRSGTERSAMRRGVNPEDMSVNPFVYSSGFPVEWGGIDHPTARELAFRDALALYAKCWRAGFDPHESRKTGGPKQNIGASLGGLSYARGRSPSTDPFCVRLHNQLMSSMTNRNSTLRALDRITSACAQKHVKVDYLTLFFDLIRAYSPASSREVQGSWSRAYSRSRTGKPQEGEKTQ